MASVLGLHFFANTPFQYKMGLNGPHKYQTILSKTLKLTVFTGRKIFGFDQINPN